MNTFSIEAQALTFIILGATGVIAVTWAFARLLGRRRMEIKTDYETLKERNER